MKKFFPLLLSACCLTALSAPVRSNLGAEGVEGIPEQDAPSAADYIQDGLVLMLDAIENVSLGVSNHGVPYVYNIAKNGPYYALSDIIFDEEALTFSRPKMLSFLSYSDAITAPFRNLSLTAEYYATEEFSTACNYWGCAADPVTNGYTFVFVGVQNNRLRVSKDGTQSWNTLTPTDKRHSSIVVSGLTMRSYCYGEYDKSTAITSAGYQYCNVFSFGNAPGFNTAKIESMRCFRLYNRELSYEEIAWNHQIDIARYGE